MPVDKAAMLAAIAQAGSAGKRAYEDAQKQLGGQQSEAIRMALSGSVAANAPGEAQAELSRIVSQPYQQRAAHLTSNRAASEDWFNRAGASAGTWGDVVGGLDSAVTKRAQLERELAETMAQREMTLRLMQMFPPDYFGIGLEGEEEGGGSGGGRGGGGGGGGSDAWDDMLKDAFGTVDIAKQSLPNEAAFSLGDSTWGQLFKSYGLAPHEFTQQYASENYGVPSATSAAWFGQPEDDAGFMSNISSRLKKIVGIKKPAKRIQAAKKLKKQTRAGAKTLPGNQKYISIPTRKAVKKVVAKAKKQAKKRKKK